MLIRSSKDIKSSEITPKDIYIRRRDFMKQTLAAGAVASAGLPSLVLGATEAQQKPGSRMIQTHAGPRGHNRPTPGWLKKPLREAQPGPFSTEEDVAPYQYVTQYNNFYEFGTDKAHPSENAKDFVTDPWSVTVSGAANKTGDYHLEDLIKPNQLEERIYRLRCVEAWSMVIPWIGIPLSKLLERFEPTSDAKYVRFVTLYDPEQMPDQRSPFRAINYPYVEGLRMDEAMNELTFMAVGLYGDMLPPQNGAPLRLVVPWKYGFKSIKSIVKIEFLEEQPRTTWEISNPREYGFYANVNPEVNHPRWSQASERRLPSSLFSPNRRDTLMFNGYGPEVAHLYSSMNLQRFF